MKKLVLFVVLSFATSLVFAQKNSELEFLKSENKISVRLDFSEALMAGMPIEDFKEYIPVHYDGKTFDYYLYPYLLDKFVSEFNDEMMEHKGKVIYVTPKLSASKYLIEIKVYMMNRNGDTNANVSFVESETNEVLVSKEYRVKGGRIGTVLNLMGDGMKNLAEVVVKYVYKNIKTK